MLRNDTCTTPGITNEIDEPEQRAVTAGRRPFVEPGVEQRAQRGVDEAQGTGRTRGGLVRGERADDVRVGRERGVGGEAERAQPFVPGERGIGQRHLLAAMPLIVRDLEAAGAQRLVHIKDLDPTPARRYGLTDPRKEPPRYWPR